MPTSNIPATFALERTTKNMYRFQEIDSVSGRVLERHDALIGTLYVKQSIFTKEPKRITITLFIEE